MLRQPKAAKSRRASCAALAIAAAAPLLAWADAVPKEATALTIQKNAANWEAVNKAGLAHEKTLAEANLVAAVTNLQIAALNPLPMAPWAWDLSQYHFLTGSVPHTVNPKLWEHAKLNMNAGLFQVSENIWQVRGFDIANITFIKGKTGWIVIDPLTVQETAAFALAFINEKLGVAREVSAVIYTHSHTDHYGGVLGVMATGLATKIYAPEGFMDAVCSENLYAGTAMLRRTFYMYGAVLPRGPKGQVDAGLGKYTAIGKTSLVAPGFTITDAIFTQKVDNVEMVFQLTNGTEAPSEMNVYIPSEKSLCVAENCTCTLHNLYTLRGAQVRDPEKWASYIDDAIKLFGNTATSVFSTHNWPRFGNEIVPYLQSQRDCYQYIKDQTLRLMSQGYTIDEVGHYVKFPKALSDQFFNGEFYGTVVHNARAVYQKYLGHYDSNPVNLHKLLPEDAARRYVYYMGGEEKILRLARQDFDKGNYQWVAEVTKHVIFANPENTAAKLLCADALEQLGYIAESGPWRNEYLFGAWELRNGVALKDSPLTVNADVYDALNPRQFAAQLAIRLNGQRADGSNMVFQVVSGNITLNLQLRNSVLVYLPEPPAAVDFVVTMADKASFYNLVSGAPGALNYAVAPPAETATFDAFLAMLDTANPRFPIVTPKHTLPPIPSPATVMQVK